MKKVTVIDSPCGEGKTTWCINYMKENIDNQNFIYVTPFNSEIIRVRKEINGELEPPKGRKRSKPKELKLYEPSPITTRKYRDFVKLIKLGKSVATTHSLFGMCTDEVAKLIEAQQYTLILDEVMNVVDEVKFKKDDIDTMIKAELIKIEDDGLVVWLDNSKDTMYDEFKYRCRNKSVYFINNRAIFWTFPVQIFRAFRKVIISTYMYDCQLQRYYYDFFNIEYEKMSVSDGNLIPYKDKKIHVENIHIYDNNKVNFVGDVNTSLSKSWFKTSKKDGKLKFLKNSVNNYIRNIMKAKSEDIIWTTFKDYEKDIASKGFTKSFVPCNSRATNDYEDRHCIVYAINKYLNPYITSFFRLRYIEIDEDMWALSEMIQFICRSAIRKGEDSYIYVPSERMRELLKHYCGY